MHAKTILIKSLAQTTKSIEKEFNFHLFSLTNSTETKVNIWYNLFYKHLVIVDTFLHLINKFDVWTLQ